MYYSYCIFIFYLLIFFFFQAEDGIRDKLVTGVQTCALPILADAECPVIVSPLNFETIDEIIFTYDGSDSSVYAIKQFTNLFPELSSKKVVVTTMVKNNDNNTVDQKEKLDELLQGHYKNIVFETLTGNARDELFTYYLEERNKILVMGALGRKRLSYFFKRS